MEFFYVKAIQHQHKLIQCAVRDHFTFRIPVPVVFFYPKIIDAGLIVRALEHVLSDFPIFAGVLVRDKGQLYVDCNNQGVSVKIIRSNQSFAQELAIFPDLPATTFVDQFDPFKALKQRKPVLTIKITYYADGTAIGYCWSHVVGDMSTFMELQKALSAFALGRSYEKPIIPEDRESYFLKYGNVTEEPSRLKRLGIMDIFRFLKAFNSRKRSLFVYFPQEEVAALRDALSDKAGRKLSRNDAMCAHLLSLIAQCRKDKETTHHASVIVDVRQRAGIPQNSLGNCVDAIMFKFDQPQLVEGMANTIHSAVKNHLFCPSSQLDFVRKNGGMKIVNQVMPNDMLPQYKNLNISSWTKFGVYSVDLGMGPPSVFLPMGEMPLPWLCCIFDGFNNRGLIVALALPAKVGNRLARPSMLEKVHQYRGSLSQEAAAVLKQNPWCV
jgi:hypothetical protein